MAENSAHAGWVPWSLEFSGVALARRRESWPTEASTRGRPWPVSCGVERRGLFSYRHGEGGRRDSPGEHRRGGPPEKQGASVSPEGTQGHEHERVGSTSRPLLKASATTLATRRCRCSTSRQH
ncbi:unnamed protein product [Ixodes hexagonus]